MAFFSSPSSFSSSKQLYTSTKNLLLLLLSLGLIAVIFLYPNGFRQNSVFTTCPGAAASANNSPTVTAAAVTKPDFRLLIGIQTLADKYERRNLLRTIYSLQAPGVSSTAEVDIRFIFCGLTTEKQKLFIALEIMRYDDIIILNCTENMDDGKTFTYFASAAALFKDRPYDYVMKADDDTYLRLDSLVESLKGKPRVDMYYGLQMPCDNENFFPFPPFMSGMGYMLSWDLIEWIATSDMTRTATKGPEDIWTGRWLNMAGKGKNRYDNAPRMYNYRGPSPATCFRHDFIPDTIAVHQLKDDSRWIETLNYFNVTQGLKPSKLYHIP